MKSSTLDDYKERILKVLVHIQRNLDEDLSLEELARVACFSAYHFHRVFTGMVGESLKEHVRRLRLERAAVQLKLSRRPVTQIAFDAGYQAHEAFTRAFKAAYGLAPLRFRARRGAHAGPAAPSGVHYHDGAALRDFRTARSGLANRSVRIEEKRPLRVAFLRHLGPYQEVGAAWDRLLPLLGSQGLIGGDSLFIGICHDDPEVTPPERIRYDACLTVDERFRPEKLGLGREVGVQTIPGGDYAVTTHSGPYRKMGETYAKLLGQWLPRSGRELRSSPCLEVYLNSPESTEPEDLLTDVHVPLQGGSG